MDVSREAAIAACEQVRERNRHLYLSPAHWQCWGCIRFGGEPEKRCMRSETGWDACPHVNRLLARRWSGMAARPRGMHLSSARRRFLGATLVVLALLGLAFALTGSPRQIPTVGPTEIGTENAPPGATVYLEGEFDSMPSALVVVVTPPGSDAPAIEVELAAPGPGFRIGEADRVTVLGTVVTAERMKDATLIWPSPPSKYIDAASKNAP